MSEERHYVVRDWGEGFWRWSCLGQHQSSEHSGILGPPFKREDAQRVAAEHWDEAHAAAPRAVEVRSHAAAPRAVEVPSDAVVPEDLVVIPREGLSLIDLEDPVNYLRRPWPAAR